MQKRAWRPPPWKGVTFYNAVFMPKKDDIDPKMGMNFNDFDMILNT